MIVHRAATVLAVTLAVLAGATGGSGAQQRFTVVPLVADHGLGAAVHDPQLVNAWGLAATRTGPWWIANEGRSSSTLYDAEGHKQALTVDVAGGPTGVVFNGGSGFVVRGGGRAAPARFLYACEDGRIRAWSPGIPHAWATEAVVVLDATGSGAVFRGLALAAGRLYVTDFHNARVLVFDERWRPIVRRGAFVDRSIPVGYAPFNIAALGGRLFVTYAWRAPPSGNDAPSGGYVDEFDRRGRLLARVATAGELAEPWGLALAPRSFGRFGGHLLVANFGTGHITAFARRDAGWVPAGRLPVEAPGIWGIAFGTGGMSGPRTTLFFTSGPHRWLGETEADVHGVLGAISLTA